MLIKSTARCVSVNVFVALFMCVCVCFVNIDMCVDVCGMCHSKKFVNKCRGE